MPEMIKINCAATSQLRLGAAANQGGLVRRRAARAQRIPVAVTFIADDAEMEAREPDAVGDARPEGLSQGVNEANAVLRGFIQQNFHADAVPAREARHGLPCESAAAVRAIHEVLLVKDGGALDASWWPESSRRSRRCSSRRPTACRRCA